MDPTTSYDQNGNLYNNNNQKEQDNELQQPENIQEQVNQAPFYKSMPFVFSTILILITSAFFAYLYLINQPKPDITALVPIPEIISNQLTKIKSNSLNLAKKAVPINTTYSNPIPNSQPENKNLPALNENIFTTKNKSFTETDTSDNSDDDSTDTTSPQATTVIVPSTQPSTSNNTNLTTEETGITPNTTEVPSSPPPTAPNSSPKVEILNPFPTFTFPTSEPLEITVRASDPDTNDYVQKVELFNGNTKIATINYRNILGDDLEGEPQYNNASTKAINYVKDNGFDDPDSLGYIYRNYFDWTNSNTDCDIKKGYIIIVTGDKNIYDVRVSENMANLEICESDNSMYVEDLHIFKWENPSEGNITIKAISYDNHNKTATDQEDFKLE